MNKIDARSAALSNPLALPSDINYASDLTADPQDATRLPTAATNGTEMPARIVVAKTSGDIVIRPLTCNDENGDPVYRTITFEAKEEKRIFFDAIKTTGTTVPLADIEIQL